MMKRFKVPTFGSVRLRNRVIIFISISVCVLLLGAGILSHYASQQIEKRLKALGWNVGSVNVNIFSQTIGLSAVEIIPGPDSAEHISIRAQIEDIIVKNIGLYDFLVNKELTVDEMFVGDGVIHIVPKTHNEDHDRQPLETSIGKITIARIVIKDLNTSIATDSLTRYSGRLNITINNIHSSDGTEIGDINAYTFDEAEATVNDIIVNSQFYEVKVASVKMVSAEETLQVDSLTLIPKYPKYKFSRIAGKQTDRVNSFVPQIEFTGIKYNQLRDSSFVASKIEIKSPEIYSFRDKRMEFRETKNKPLPIAAIKQFNIGVEVDTLKITDAKITYEEFPSEGFKSGKIVFEDLQAVLVNVSDKVYQNRPRYATLDASAKIMGKGLIQASFQLPLDADDQYHAKGKLSQLALYHLNPALENLAFIRIESGRLNNMDFDFDYNDRSSSGSLTINYQDLKMTGLKKERSPDESDFKTFLINTIIKNDKDKDVPIGKRTGKIEFERDRKRQIFNYWWKSLLSGIKASVLNSEKSSGKSKDARKK
ncbi:MAG TPA: DUF748 domain-containing protein [Chryseolinea sp.]|nr:DUF748 domain-containing protein [Chryseolinea sp.]